jgi:ubiquinone/menaquinone biosynthesis C-methylase UbiE
MSTSGTKKYWTKHASSWDSIYLDESAVARRMNLVFRKAIYERMRVALEAPGEFAGKSVLDVGCGTGRYAIECAKRGAERAVGIDFAPTMLEIARRHAAEAGVEDKCEFLQGDFSEFETDEKFDVVVANGFFDYMEDPTSVLSKLASLSRSLVIASFPGKSPVRNWLRKTRYGLQGCAVYFYAEKDLHELAAAAGIEDYSLQYVPHSGTGHMLVARVAP